MGSSGSSRAPTYPSALDLTLQALRPLLADPEVTIDYDVDRAAATQSRKKLLGDAASTGILVGGAHISFPGLGHVSADATGYHWVALPYHATVSAAY